MNRSALAVVSVTIFLLFCGVLYPAPAHSPEGSAFSGNTQFVSRFKHGRNPA